MPGQQSLQHERAVQVDLGGCPFTVAARVDHPRAHRSPFAHHYSWRRSTAAQRPGETAETVRSAVAGGIHGELRFRPSGAQSWKIACALAFALRPLVGRCVPDLLERVKGAARICCGENHGNGVRNRPNSLRRLGGSSQSRLGHLQLPHTRPVSTRRGRGGGTPVRQLDARCAQRRAASLAASVAGTQRGTSEPTCWRCVSRLWPGIKGGTRSVVRRKRVRLRRPPVSNAPRPGRNARAATEPPSGAEHRAASLVASGAGTQLGTTEPTCWHRISRQRTDNQTGGRVLSYAPRPRRGNALAATGRGRR